MPVVGFDHVALPTQDAERCLAFYKRLGFAILGEEAWRQGQAPTFAIQVGPQAKINIHPPGFVAPLRGETARPGCGDLCFVWEGGLEALLATLRRAGVAILEGPVPRRGGRDGGRRRGRSVYLRDPDGNLLEFIVYE
ncbi:MAG: virulence protein [Candidatus Tectimicrobiota bacterium]|nr:MAG: virulence protein [Candidatus Tectomicrobia bacterium]